MSSRAYGSIRIETEPPQSDSIRSSYGRRGSERKSIDLTERQRCAHPLTVVVTLAIALAVLALVVNKNEEQQLHQHQQSHVFHTDANEQDLPFDRHRGWTFQTLSSQEIESLIVFDGPGSDGMCNDTVYYYDDQLIDHFSEEKHKDDNKWTQRYYFNDDYWQGPGHPIFFIMGGEGVANCLFYPLVTFSLAKIFGGCTLEAEHRFYGQSQPIELEKNSDMIGLLTPDQAIADYLRLLRVMQEELGCSTDRTSPDYCPVITVGASYPGFLSAIMRLVHPDVVDAAYCSSAPLPLYAQDVDQYAYYDKVTESAERASAGCPAAVKSTLMEIDHDLEAADSPDFYQTAAKNMGICMDTFPHYIHSNEMFRQEIMMAVGANFADFNMMNYPPAPDNQINRACHVFQSSKLDSYKKMEHLWRIMMEDDDLKCFDLHSQIPDGAHGTVSSADWTGGGPGKTGLSWEFQTCTDLVVQTGFGKNSMFPPRKWTLEWLTAHCQARFGVDPAPTRMVDQWHFDDLLGQNASRFLFTNGLNDGWSVDSILENLSPDIVAINMENGAHHSDISHFGPSHRDTDDVVASYPLIIQTIDRFLADIRNESQQQ